MFRLVERPTLMPARTLTGSTVGPVVDTEVILHNGGRPYLSEIESWECVVKFPTYAKQLGIHAREAGWTSPDDTNALHDRIAELEHQRDEALAGQPKVLSLEDALALAEVTAA